MSGGAAEGAKMEESTASPGKVGTTAAPLAALPPGSWLGIFGGGQLGRMFSMAAQTLGYRVCVLDPAADSPAGAVADAHLRAAYEDADALEQLAARCAAVTTEFENVPARALARIADRIRVHPSAGAVAAAQDRLTEKRFIVEAGVPVAPHVAIQSAAEAAAVAPTLLPGILKVARLGYDGKGQATVATPTEVEDALTRFGGVPCVLEQRLDLAAELSVIVARGADGTIVPFPVGRNWHRDGILAMTRVPSGLDEALERQAVDATRAIAERLDYVGVLCVEYFVLGDGRLVANEMAPRPHNSGHYSIDASLTSQFEQQARALAGLPLGASDLLSPSLMLNILGDAWYEPGSDQQREPDWAAVLAHPRARLHLYGKTEARRGRKMGHLTLIGAPWPQLLADARDLAPLIAQVVPE